MLRTAMQDKAGAAPHGVPVRRVRVAPRGLRAAAWSLAWALALPLLPACAPVVVQALPSLDCPVPAERLAARCAAPGPVADGSNYGQALQAWAVDRKALADCRDREALLISTVQACQAAIAQHNAQLRQLEQAAKDRP